MVNKAVLFYFPSESALAKTIAEQCHVDLGEINFHTFPDAETLLTINPIDLKGREVILLASLNQPNEKTLPLLFLAKTLKDFGAANVGLISPYLSYMRQDTRFEMGQVVSAKCFADILSMHFDWMITLDPHLHRYKTLDEIYTIPAYVLSATDIVADWIYANVKDPVLIGPDVESEQWITRVAAKHQLPYVVLRKIRHTDEHVEISEPQLSGYQQCTPILIDDIISTAGTMIKTVERLEQAGMAKVICIGVHAVFAHQAYEKLQQAFVDKIVTCNTIKHDSNGIDIAPVIAQALRGILGL